MQHYWFRAKDYGWGWYPATWEGWLVLAIFIAAMVWNGFRLDVDSRSVSDTLRPFFIQTTLLVATLLVICWVKGERPVWRWGGKPMFKK